MTQQDLIADTAGYPSPEQASGQASGQCADVWASGAVLFETLSGLPLFSGESPAQRERRFGAALFPGLSAVLLPMLNQRSVASQYRLPRQ